MAEETKPAEGNQQRQIKIDESNDPLDPQQLGAAFASALQPLSLKSNALLIDRAIETVIGKLRNSGEPNA